MKKSSGVLPGHTAPAVALLLAVPRAPGEGRIGAALALDHAAAQWVELAYRNKGDQANRALPGYETMFAQGDNSWRLQKLGIRDSHKPPADLIELDYLSQREGSKLLSHGTTQERPAS
jgi:hypothetical protein